MRSNCAASSLSKSGSKTNSFLGRDWLGDGANLDSWDADMMDSLLKSPKIKSMLLLLGMFYKCRLDFRQTGLIFEENTQSVRFCRAGVPPEAGSSPG